MGRINIDDSFRDRIIRIHRLLGRSKAVYRNIIDIEYKAIRWIDSVNKRDRELFPHLSEFDSVRRGYIVYYDKIHNRFKLKTHIILNENETLVWKEIDDQLVYGDPYYYGDPYELTLKFQDRLFKYFKELNPIDETHSSLIKNIISTLTTIEDSP